VDKAKLALFLLGGFVVAMAILVEFGSVGLVGSVGVTAGISDQPPPGIGLLGIGLIDLVLGHALVLMAIDFVAPLRAGAARIQGIATFVLSLLGILGTVVFAFATYALLMLMITLLLATPFGTIAYFAVWGHFPTASARVALGLVMSLKLFGIGLIAVSHQTLLKNLGFVVLAACSIAMTFVLGLLYAIPPIFLVSITDAIGALVAAIVAVVWMVVVLVGAIFAVIRAVRSVGPV
jgi:hypothetical protein